MELELYKARLQDADAAFEVWEEEEEEDSGGRRVRAKGEGGRKGGRACQGRK